ncbi:inositol monophosphatase family protein [Wielerella bovis]|uniref:inositol monophosphatase family protein n=1 Tax=Wielerella bovis TaxID=2917790 RepID=UPI002018EC2C|nr:inositol monophosphatase family protein [Wielerella bovis]ULJ68466.1 inositol monophosphatase family protein [Wielerella bovis]
MKPINTLTYLVREVAASEMMPYFLKTAHSRKDDGSVLSQADMATQNALVFRLPQIIAAPVLGEEMSAAQQQQLWQSADVGLWVIDPLDGTNNFVNGIPHFAISVAYVQGGRAMLGAVYNPVSDECFYAVRGEGAWLNDTPLPLRRVSKKLHEAVAGVETKRLRSAKLVNSINYFLPVGTMRNMGSSTLDWCYLAAGRYDVYVHGGQNLWDYAAGALILEESGGLLTTLEGDDFWSGLHAFKRSVIAAGQPELFEKWVAWVRKNQ